MDGMAIDILPEGERGRANAFMGFGQAAGFSLFGAVNGYLLVNFGLGVTALVSTITVGCIFAFVAAVREREGERLMPWTAGAATPRTFAVSESFTGIFRDLIRVIFSADEPAAGERGIPPPRPARASPLPFCPSLPWRIWASALTAMPTGSV